MDKEKLLDLTGDSKIAGRYEIVRRTAAGSTFVSYLCRNKAREGKLTSLTLFFPEIVQSDISNRGRQTLLTLLSYGVASDLVVRPDSIVDEDGLLGIAAEAPDAETLLDLDPQIGIARAIDVICQLCDALKAAEASGMIVREALPEDLIFVTETKIRLFYLRSALNVFLQTHGSKEEVARVLAYCAPEYIEQGTADAPVDVYLAGALGYHVITGVAPFDAEERGRLTAQKRLSPPMARRVRKDCPLVLSNIIAKAMAGKPGERHGSVAELAEDLEVLRKSLSGQHISSESAAKVALSATDAIKRQAAYDEPTVSVQRPRSLRIDALVFLSGFLVLTAVGVLIVRPQTFEIVLPESPEITPSPPPLERPHSSSADANFVRSLERIRDSMNVRHVGSETVRQAEPETSSSDEAPGSSSGADAPAGWTAAPTEASAGQPAGPGVSEDAAKLRLMLDAAAACDDMLVNEMLRAGVSPNRRNAQGDTALALAIQSKCVAAVKLLLSRGAAVELRSKEGFLPYDMAKQIGFTEGERLLKEAGALETPPAQRLPLDLSATDSVDSAAAPAVP